VKKIKSNRKSIKSKENAQSKTFGLTVADDGARAPLWLRVTDG